jgi:hypothetical protein
MPVGSKRLATARISGQKPGPEGKRPVNSWGVVNQRFGEFWTEILGFDGNHRGSFRDLPELSRNGDFWSAARIAVNPCGNGGKRETPGEPNSRHRAFTGLSRRFAISPKAPRVGLEQGPKYTGKTNTSRKGGAKSGAPGAPTEDRYLARIIAAWPKLPAAIRRAMLALVGG